AIELHGRHRLVRPLAEQLHIGKARVGGEGTARVDDGDGIAGQGRHRRQRLRIHQRLCAGRQLRHQHDSVFRGPVLEQSIENVTLHCRASTKTCTLPPQASPTSQACSLVTPKSSNRGLPSLMAASASCTTAPSMQPPETEPIIAPLSSTASWLPTGRGEEPHVVTTVAIATPLPCVRHAAACSRMSSR